MILLTILMASALITMTRCAPAAHLPREAVDLPEMLWLIDQRMPELEKEMYDTSNDPGSTIVRTKRIGSLSIVNSLDVLRQRVLLELARRKALQDQRQIDANRRLLETIGKRSAPVYENYDSSSRPRNSERILDWLDENGPLLREPHNDRERRVESNELFLL
ncbi:hypothetical protein KPH14_004293 [Odynerus spinipes]|uniref:Corticotropin-releasing factor domain-containing protein n=1 Tax=Odynerus spinipes TaxID=1348599 RepID=A0AAD9RYH4_9HYME|nr:hypothetical protein KPH14_004293 [Odynerus spinipes]